MSTVFGPRQVEPGALRRWAWQALGLIARAPASWLVCAGVFLGLAMLVSSSWFGMAFVGAWSHIHVQLMANRADRGALSLAGVPGSFAASLFEVWLHFTRTPVSSVVNVLTCSLVPYLFGFNPFFMPEGVGSKVVLAGPMQLMALGIGMALGAMLIAVGAGFMTHGFLLARLTGAPFARLMLMTRDARLKNGLLALGFDMGVVACCALAMRVPVLLVPVCAFLGAWSYVSFRDVYLHQDGNQELARSPVVPADLQPATTEAGNN